MLRGMPQQKHNYLPKWKSKYFLLCQVEHMISPQPNDPKGRGKEFFLEVTMETICHCAPRVHMLRCIPVSIQTWTEVLTHGSIERKGSFPVTEKTVMEWEDIVSEAITAAY